MIFSVCQRDSAEATRDTAEGVLFAIVAALYRSFCFIFVVTSLALCLMTWTGNWHWIRILQLGMTRLGNEWPFQNSGSWGVPERKHVLEAEKKERGVRKHLAEAGVEREHVLEVILAQDQEVAVGARYDGRHAPAGLKQSHLGTQRS